VKDTPVVVQMDNRRTLNMENIISDVKSQYEEISACSRKEVEACYKNKVKIRIGYLGKSERDVIEEKHEIIGAVSHEKKSEALNKISIHRTLHLISEPLRSVISGRFSCFKLL